MTVLTDEDRRLFEAAVEQFAQRGGARAVAEKGDGGAGGAPATPAKRRRRSRGRAESPRVAETLDLHGQHLEEALASLERFVTASPSGRWLRVIHGHGTGTLARACRRMLERDSRVAEVRPPLASSAGRAELLVLRR